MRFDLKMRFLYRLWKKLEFLKMQHREILHSWGTAGGRQHDKQTDLRCLEGLCWKERKCLRMLSFVVLPPPPVGNKVFSTVMETWIIAINHVYGVIFFLLMWNAKLKWEKLSYVFKNTCLVECSLDVQEKLKLKPVAFQTVFWGTEWVQNCNMVI